MVFLGFVVTTHEDVGGDAAAWDDALDVGDALQILPHGCICGSSASVSCCFRSGLGSGCACRGLAFGDGLENVLIGHILAG